MQGVLIVASICRTATRRARNSITSWRGSSGFRAPRSCSRRRLPAVPAGDFNVVPTDLDIYTRIPVTRSMRRSGGPRESFPRLLEQGWTDAARAIIPDEPIYTFWHNRFATLRKQAMPKLDFALVSREPGVRPADLPPASTSSQQA